MDIILHNVDNAQLPVIRELAKVLGISLEKNETSPGIDSLRDDEVFHKEMNRRFEDLESGKVKGMTVAQLKSGAQKIRRKRA